MRTKLSQVFSFYIKFIVMVGSRSGHKGYLVVFSFCLDGDRMRMMMFEKSQSKTMIVKQ